MSDQDRISPYIITAKWSRLSDKNKETYQFGIISWSNTKFSKLTS